ncbi:MAG: class I SAM-dependent methyltransferase [Gammaproteobacteria bacterium]|nr:class I SAM-dependent methyltransferase [Gammaproteobacteria bacterium]
MAGSQKEFDRRAHWEKVYESKAPETVSWYQAAPSVSLDLIQRIQIPHNAAIIDVGGGASVLVDSLIEEGFTDISVLDIAGAALNSARERLGDAAANITWIESDVTSFVAEKQYLLWHDRAVFHFLTDVADRKKYVRALKQSLLPNGHLIIATFATDGPAKCSGLNIVQYDETKLSAELGTDFKLIATQRETHITPAKTKQNFQYFYFRKAS